MDNKKIRLGKMADMHDILKIYARAKVFMAESGNPTQWSDGYPARDLLEADIEKDNLYVVEENGAVTGVFCFIVGVDPTYEVIEGGCWRSDAPYGTIHRIAGDGSGGIFQAALTFCREKISHIRIDTHEKNLPMRHLVEKHGFSRRGIIYVADGTPRIAFDLL